MKEEWKWIKGFEGLYQISNYGRLKSFGRDSNGYIYSNKNRHGWYFTVILRKDGTKQTRRIHRLVAEAFIGEIPKGYHVHHKDGNKQNNHVDNLEIIHPSQHKLETIKLNPNYLNGMNNYNKYERPKRVRQLTLDGCFVAEYANAVIASELTGVCGRNIIQVARKEKYGKNGRTRKQAGGYRWEFADEGGDKK